MSYSRNPLTVSAVVIVGLMGLLPVAAIGYAHYGPKPQPVAEELPVAQPADRHAVWAPICGYLPGSVEPMTLGVEVSSDVDGYLTVVGRQTEEEAKLDGPEDPVRTSFMHADEPVSVNYGSMDPNQTKSFMFLQGDHGIIEVMEVSQSQIIEACSQQVESK